MVVSKSVPLSAQKATASAWVMTWLLKCEYDTGASSQKFPVRDEYVVHLQVLAVHDGVLVMELHGQVVHISVGGVGSQL